MIGERSALRFWITKNSQLSVREQLVRQVILAILSDDLRAGQKLPSTRALARLCQVHSNTVSAAYHQLLDRGWLELRRGSGLYVRPQQANATDGNGLDGLLNGLLRAARSHGYRAAEVLERLTHLVEPPMCRRVCLVEADPSMREILLAEVREHVAVPVDAVDAANIPSDGDRLVVALPSRAAAVRKHVPKGVSFLTLRLRSVRGSLEKETRPAPNAIVSIVSRSPEFRQWARVMLIAVGLEPACLCDVNTAEDAWQERARVCTLAVADVVAARNLPPECVTRVFRVIADASVAEMKQYCGL
jgi:DNA-binding transcriptional regulator YhcF (GntR family)